MLKHDRIDASEEIDVNKTNVSKKCDICHSWYFLDEGFKFEPNVCNSCHDLMHCFCLQNSFLVYEQR